MRDRNFTEGKLDKRPKQIEESIQRYLNALEGVVTLKCWGRSSPIN